MGISKSKPDAPLVLPESRLVCLAESRPIMHLRGDGSLNSPCSPNSIAIQQSTKHIFIADTHPFGRVSVFTSSLNFITTFNNPRMTIPWGVAVQADSLFVTDKSESLHHFMEDSGFCRVSSTFDIFSKNSQFFGLRQIVLSNDGKIYLAEFYNFRVQVLDSRSFSLVRYISHPSLVYPTNLYLTTSELYVLLMATYCVKVFSLDGELLRSIVRRQFGGCLTVSSLFFCLDTRRNIIITDSDRAMIKVFSNAGDLLYSMVIEEEFKRIFQFSRGLALTSDSNIILASIDGISELRYNPVI